MRHTWGVLRRLLSFQVLKAGLGILVVASLASASAVAVQHGHDPGHPPAQLAVGPPTPLPVAPATFPDTELRLFRAVSHRPAATAPVRKLPKVDVAALTVDGIPSVALRAYRGAAATVAATDPGCHLRWWLVAGIGLVESGHARTGGSMVAGWNGVARPPILGPVLNGSHGFMAIPDTDNGVYDGNRRWDRAVGPMQFLPSTWLRWGPTTKNGQRANPQDIRAAAKATGNYLCASGLDLAAPHAMALAVYSYNHSFDYVRLVLTVAARYAGMSPDQLDVNQLPHDKKKARHAGKARHHRKRSAAVTASASAQPALSPSTTGSPATPTPAPSASPTGAPSPSPSPLPLPTLTPPLH